MLRVFLSRPGRPQISPQQYCVTSSCSGRLKSSAVANALSTKSAPRTWRRMPSPFSNISLSKLVSLLAAQQPDKLAAEQPDNISHGRQPVEAVSHLEPVPSGTTQLCRPDGADALYLEFCPR